MFPLTIKFERKLDGYEVEYSGIYLSLIKEELNSLKILDVKIEGTREPILERTRLS